MTALPKYAKTPARHAGIGLLLVGIVFCFAAWPPLASLFEEGVQGAFKYFASDSFYYLAIADESSVAGYYTFDGLNPTSGFHPLWEFYLRSSFGALQLNSEQQIMFTALSSVVFSSVGVALFAWVVFGLTGRFAVALLASVPGLFFLLMPHFGKSFAAHWNFSNGMESPLSVFWFGAMLLFVFSGRRAREVWRRRDLLLLSVLVTALILTRLDDIFMLVPFGLYALVSGTSPRDRMVRAVAISLVPTVVLAGYMGFNFAYAGTFLPSSGVAKAEPLWAVFRNGYAIFTTLFPFLDFMRPELGVWKPEGWRVAQMVIPAALAFYWVARTRHVNQTDLDHFSASPTAKAMVLCLAGYVILKAAYNFSAVSIWHQGGWYYVVTIMTCNLILALLISELLERARKFQGDRAERGWLCRNEQLLSGVAASLLVLVVANSATDAKRNGREQDRNYRFWSERAEAQEWIDTNCSDCGVVSFDDGIVAYSLDGVPTLNGLGLVMDGEAEAAKDRGHLLDLAWERGHRLLVTVNYPMVDAAYERPAALRAHLEQNGHLDGQALDPWHFEVAFRMPGSQVNFIRFVPDTLARGAEGNVLARHRSEGQPARDTLGSMFGS